MKKVVDMAPSERDALGRRAREAAVRVLSRSALDTHLRISLADKPALFPNG